MTIIIIAWTRYGPYPLAVQNDAMVQWIQQAEHNAAMEGRAQEVGIRAVAAPAVREKVNVYRVGPVPDEVFSRGTFLAS